MSEFPCKYNGISRSNCDLSKVSRIDETFKKSLHIYKGTKNESYVFIYPHNFIMFLFIFIYPFLMWKDRFNKMSKLFLSILRMLMMNMTFHLHKLTSTTANVSKQDIL